MLRYAILRWPLWALIASAVMLGIAHGFETFGHLAPCELCLVQRQAYWAAMGIAAVGVVLDFTPVKARALICLLLAGAFLWGGGYAVYHAGAEWKFWPGPSTCSGGSVHVNAADLARLLQGVARRVPHCDEAPWVFAGLSMAGWNVIASLILASFSLVSIRKPSK